jgi:riboflavin kinase/FMN adenylyltransferase
MAVHFNTNELPRFSKAVITIGTFDGVHLGHKTILQEVVRHAKEVNGESVLITFEPHPRKLIFPNQPLKLLTPLKEKIALISNEGIEHIVVVPFTRDFSNLTAGQYIEDFLVKNFQPESIVIGYDHHFGYDRTGNIELLKKYADTLGYKVYEISAQLIDEAAVSSTKIREALNEGRVADAAHMLGRNYCLGGHVIGGAKLGRTIGYPTANLLPEDPEQLIPANGVYTIKATWNKETYGGMLNIGHRPTVDKDMKLHIEAHLFEFDKDIYDEHLELAFVLRLRDEVKFPSVDALKEQLHKDMQDARRILAG